jgi:hypothetical protein
MTLLHSVLLVFFIVEFIVDKDKAQARVMGAFDDGMTTEAFFGLAVAFVVVLVPLVLAIAQLFLFHMMLLHKKLTTYEYIVQEERERNTKERERREAKRAQQHEVELAKIKAAEADTNNREKDDNNISGVVVVPEDSNTRI